MSGLTKLGLVLIPMLGFFLLALAAEILYMLFYFRIFRGAGAGDPELAGAASLRQGPLPEGFSSASSAGRTIPAWNPPPSSSTPVLRRLREAATTAAAPGEMEMEKLQQMYASRALFTIREEEEEKEVLELDDGGRSVGSGRRTVAADGEVVEATFSFSSAGLSRHSTRRRLLPLGRRRLTAPTTSTAHPQKRSRPPRAVAINGPSSSRVSLHSSSLQQKPRRWTKQQQQQPQQQQKKTRNRLISPAGAAAVVSAAASASVSVGSRC
ncbi:unnamed protein product [Spirodela intermedia]|uniref:Uncharacterized protein n=1 Tax=Spirodela intermedia TaxID=51605 RepID=A0A7I8IRJ4_SPIIN|nr:unnamed protein product [Spirodela intermedia]CAA6660611.1 unnamed protein product [Spirodela intermedia]